MGLVYSRWVSIHPILLESHGAGSLLLCFVIYSNIKSIFLLKLTEMSFSRSDSTETNAFMFKKKRNKQQSILESVCAFALDYCGDLFVRLQQLQAHVKRV